MFAGGSAWSKVILQPQQVNETMDNLWVREKYFCIFKNYGGQKSIDMKNILSFEKRLIRKSVSVCLFLIFVFFLTWTYFSNPFDRTNHNFNSFEAVSEALAIGPFVAERSGVSPLDEGYGLGYYHENTGDTTSYWTDTLSLYRGETEYLSNKDFFDGYGLSGDVLAFSANLYTDTYYIPGHYFLFADGSKAVITEVDRKDNMCYVTVNIGLKLCKEKNGSLSEIRLFDASGKELPRGIFSKYPSQIGMQGRVLRNLVRLFPYNSAVTWSHLLTAVAMAFVAVFILFLLNKKFGVGMVLVWGGVFLLSPWIVQFARNLYWVEFTWFLPMAFGLLCSVYADRKKIVGISCIGVLLSVFLKSTCGYEYITTVMMGSILFLMADAGTALLTDKKIFSKIFKRILLVAIAALLGFLAAVCIHAYIRADGDIWKGLCSIYEKNVLERTWGGNPEDFPESERASLEASALTVLKLYFHFDTSLIMGISGEFFVGLCILSLLTLIWRIWKDKKNGEIDKSIIYLLFLLISAFFTSVSWFVLGKAHSYIHTQMNFVMWYFGFIQLLFYIPLHVLWMKLRGYILRKEVNL